MLFEMNHTYTKKEIVILFVIGVLEVVVLLTAFIGAHEIGKKHFPRSRFITK